MDVKGFYNRKKKQTQKERAQSPLLALRKYNNYVKSALIASALQDAMTTTPGQDGVIQPQGAHILDLCGGFGGDLSKYAHHNVKQVVLVDISEESVEEARRRYEQGRFPYEAQFHCCNAFHFETMRKLLFPQSFDLITCQFALHYAFVSAHQVNDVFRLISWALKSTGKFIATVPNADEIRPKLQVADTWCFGHAQVERGGLPHEYLFTLDTAVERVPEYYVDRNIVEEVARKWGLCLERWGGGTEPHRGHLGRPFEPPNSAASTILLDEKSSFVKTFYISFVLSKIKE